MRVYQKISLHRCTLTIVLAVLIESITIQCATVDPASFYQQSNDGSYRYGYNGGDGFNARQSANAANEVVGQYSQLQPDGRIANVRYKAGVGGFRPQYGAAHTHFNGAGSGQHAGQFAGYGAYGGGSGPFGARSLSGGSSFGAGSLYTPGFNSNAAAASYGGPLGSRTVGGELYEARSLGGGALGRGAFGAGSLGGGPGSRSFGAGYGGVGSGAEGLQGGEGFGSNVAGSSSGSGPFGASLPGRSNAGGGYSNDPNSSSLGPGSTASRSPIGGSLGVGSFDGRTVADGASALRPTGNVGSSTGSNVDPFGSHAFGRSPQVSPYGSVYGGVPRYGANPAFGTTFGYPRIPLAFVYSTPRPFVTPSVTPNSTPSGDGSYRFQNDGSGSSTEGNPAIRDFDVAGPNTGYRSTGSNIATTPNGLPNQIASSTSTQSPRTRQQANPQNDGTYNFAYRTPDATRQESADGQGNVQAGPSTGFQPTGGSLAVPNGLGQGRSLVNSTPGSAIGSTGVGNDNGGHGVGNHRRSGHGQNNNGVQNSLPNRQVLNEERSQNDQRLLSEARNGANSQFGSGVGESRDSGEYNGFQQTGLRRSDGNVGSSGSTGNQRNGFAYSGLGSVGSGRLPNTYGQSGEGNFDSSSGYGTQSTIGGESAFNRGNGLTNTGFGAYGGGSLSNPNGQSRAGNADGYGSQLTTGNSGSLSRTGSTLNRGNGLVNSGFGNNGAGSLSNSNGQSEGGSSGGTLNYRTQTSNGNPGSSSIGGIGFNRGNGLTSAGFRSNNERIVTGSSSYDTANSNEGGNGSYNFQQQSLNYRLRPGTRFEEKSSTKTTIPK